MTTPIFFYSPGACSFGGIVVLEWVAKPYLLCRVEPKIRASDAFKRINPQGKVGALKIGEHLLAENFAILLYIATQTDHPFCIPPRESFQYHLMNQWLSYLASGFHTAFGPLFGPSRYIEKEEYYPLVKEMALKNVQKQYHYVNEHLAHREYLLGQEKSILDPYFYGLARWGKNFFTIETQFPHVAHLLHKMEEDPAVQFALSIEKGENAQSPSGAFQGHVDLNKV